MGKRKNETTTTNARAIDSTRRVYLSGIAEASLADRVGVLLARTGGLLDEQGQLTQAGYRAIGR